MEQENNDIEFTIEIFPPNGESPKKVDNVKIQDVVQTIKKLEHKDYPVSNFWGKNCTYGGRGRDPKFRGTFLEVISQQNINEKEGYGIDSEKPIMSFSSQRIIGYVRYDVHLTRRK